MNLINMAIKNENASEYYKIYLVCSIFSEFTETLVTCTSWISDVYVMLIKYMETIYVLTGYRSRGL